MVQLLTQKQFSGVSALSFCYLCGKNFLPDDVTDRDHNSARGVFASTDRQPALILKSHKACNWAQGIADNKIGQLLKLKRGEVPSNPKHRILKFTWLPRQAVSAVTNVEVDRAVWRWIRGFHAALYGEPLEDRPERALVTPFQRGRPFGRNFGIEGIKPQHLKFVEVIKANRVRNNLDRICSNRGKLTYECVWVRMQAQTASPWACVFALDLYDWKDLGAPELGQRGCAGCYLLPDGRRPHKGTAEIISKVLVPNYEPLDPFGH
jgi:hypothetical protein